MSTPSSNRLLPFAILALVAICVPSKAPAQAPENDHFANAEVLTGVFGGAAGTNVDATMESGEPTTTDGRTGGNSVWFRWVAPASGSFMFSLTSDFDSQLAVYSGTAGDSLASIAESDSPGAGSDSVTFPALEGTDYHLRITGYLSQSGVVTLNWGANPVYEKFFSFTPGAGDVPVAQSVSPQAGLVQGSDGNFYGTTSGGGATNDGTVFKLTPGGDLTTLVEFTGIGGSSKGSYPDGALVQGSDGNFYGTTRQGGASNDGTVFKLTPGGVVTTLVEFTRNAGSNKGKGPRGALVPGLDGNFYGTTTSGGATSMGTVFRMTPGGELTTLVEFTGTAGSNLGKHPEAGLVQGSDGNFYGTTSRGGASDEGTVFKLTPDGVLTTLVEFTGTGGSSKGRHPFGVLVESSNGNFYGTTLDGGASDDGTVFKLTPGGDLTTLVEFVDNEGSNAGYRPQAGLVQGRDGDFYGTTHWSGTTRIGTVFRMTPGGVLTTLVEFTGNAGSNKGSSPDAELVQGSDGDFYGTTSGGGASGGGTVFKLTPEGNLTTLVEFAGTVVNPKGSRPEGDLVQGRDGNFYGTTTYGGTAGMGTVFTLTSGGELTTLVEFRGGTTGTRPRGLVEGSDGSFYGTTYGAYASNDGTVFKMTPGGELTTLVEFTGTGGGNKGSYPDAGLLQGRDGDFYGTTSRGGASDDGTVFKMTPGGVLTTLVEFTGNAGSNKGSSPRCDLVQGSDGSFYGTTAFGGASRHGTVFKLTPGGELTTLVEFAGAGGNPDGEVPLAGLVEGSDGNFYGTTSGGFSNVRTPGTVFKVTPGGVLTTLVEFTGTAGSNRGGFPDAGLVQGRDGNFYGSTTYGGTNDRGTVFKMTPGGELTTLHDFAADEPDPHPNTALLVGSDGNLYGTTWGTSFGNGGIYRMAFPGMPNVALLPPAGLTATSVALQCEVNPHGGDTTVSLEYGHDGVAFPNSLVIPLSMTGHQWILVGRTLGDLTPGTTYYYRFRATSSLGESVSPVESISTLAEPVVAIAAAGELTPTSARLHGSVNARNHDATVYFEWGTDGNSFPHTVGATPDLVTGNAPVSVSADVAGLVKGSKYFFRVVATNAAGTVVSGTQSFTTLTEPVASLGAASALSTTRARVEGTVDARGSEVTVVFEYGIDGVTFGNSVTATPAVVSGSGPVPLATTLTGLLQGTTYHYRIRASGPGGEGVSGTGTFSLSLLSGLNQVFPDPPPVTTGSVTVTFDPAAIGAWRFAGEREWRSSGVAATHLAGGLRVIEYLPVLGHIGPPDEGVDVENGVSQELQRSYFTTPGFGSGSLTVTLKPAAVVGEGAKWRFLGEAAWRDSGVPATGLVAGTYLVECQAVAGRVTPPVATISLAAGEQRELALTYYRANDPVGDAPQVLDFAEVSTNEDASFAYLGQIRSEVGSSTGFVVKRRVVATAGHVVFDDGTLEHVVGLEWLLQRHAGEYEPRPQVPRGFYLAAGYADQRGTDASPGEGSPESQDLDYAALYFLEEAGRGGYGGFLASALGDANEFLDSNSDKILAGYAVDGAAASARGKLHATPVFTTPLTPAYGETWTSSAVHGLGGCSGGPLFVRHANGSLYPAAIYLGGSNQTVVRAIDPDVVDLFLRAEVSGNGGGNNTSGGVTHTNATALGSATQPGSITILIEPPEARAHSEAGWWLEGPDTATSGKRHGDTHSGLNAGTYNLNMVPLPGFETPQAVPIDAVAGIASTYTYTYVPESPELNQWRTTHFGDPNHPDAADDADPDGDGCINIDEFVAGTDPNNAMDCFRVRSSERVGIAFTVQVEAKAGRVYEMQLFEPPATGDPADAGSWANRVTLGPLDADATISLTDPANSATGALYRVRVTKP